MLEDDSTPERELTHNNAAVYIHYCVGENEEGRLYGQDWSKDATVVEHYKYMELSIPVAKRDDFHGFLNRWQGAEWKQVSWDHPIVRFTAKDKQQADEFMEALALKNAQYGTYQYFVNQAEEDRLNLW